MAMSDVSQLHESEEDEEEWELSDEARAQVELLENPELVQEDE